MPDEDERDTSDEDDEPDTDDEEDAEHHAEHHEHRREIARVPGAGPGGPLAFLERAQDVLTVKRVFGEPIERSGVTIIPAASVGGGGGGGAGGGESEGQRGSGHGGGFGVSARPAGVYIIGQDGSVRWRPAIDVNRTIFMGQLVAIVFLLTVRSVVKAIAKRR